MKESNTYKFGNRVFEIKTQYSFFYEYAKEYIYITSPNEEVVDISYTKEDLEKYKKEKNDPAKIEVIEAYYILSRICDELVKDNTFLMHGSSFYVDNPNNGFIITAPSGEGKSTHSRLLKELLKDRFTYINDDKPFIRCNEDNSFSIIGNPYDGKDRLSSNQKASLKAIFVLSQSKSNSVTKLNKKDSLNYLFKQIHIPNGEVYTSKVLDLVLLMNSSIDVYLLNVDISKEAALTSYSIIEQFIK